MTEGILGAVEHEGQLDPNIMGLAELPGPPDTIIVFPDLVQKPSSRTVVSFRAETQLLRGLGAQEGVSVELATPEGAELAEYSEHDVAIVLPIVSWAGAIALNILSSWIWELMRSRPEQTLRFREVVIEDGRRSLTEIEGSADAVIEALQTRLGDGS